MDELVALGGDGEAEPLVDAINDRQPAVEGELDLVPAVIEQERPGERLPGLRGSIWLTGGTLPGKP